SNIVTTALTSSHGLFLRPPSRLGSPVPPPKQPTVNVRSRTLLSVVRAALGPQPADSRKLRERIDRMARVSDHIVKLERELRGIFATRLESLVAYDLHETKTPTGGGAHGHAPGALAHTLAIVKSLTESDLKACADLVAAWHENGLSTPLILTAG